MFLFSSWPLASLGMLLLIKYAVIKRVISMIICFSYLFSILQYLKQWFTYTTWLIMYKLGCDGQSINALFAQDIKLVCDMINEWNLLFLKGAWAQIFLVQLSLEQTVSVATKTKWLWAKPILECLGALGKNSLGASPTRAYHALYCILISSISN